MKKLELCKTAAGSTYMSNVRSSSSSGRNEQVPAVSIAGLDVIHETTSHAARYKKHLND